MLNLNNPNERAGLIGTIVFHLLLLFLAIMLGYCTDLSAVELDAGGVTVALGTPDAGAEDNSTQDQQEEYTPPVEEEYTPENQLTSDVEEAPAVKETPPNKPKPKTTPKETTEKTPDKPKEERKPSTRDLFSKKDKGDGSGGGTTGGDRGAEDGKEGGSPDGAGDGNGSGIDLGNGISGGIGGFKVAKVVAPRGGVQEQGVVRLRVCVDERGNVNPGSIKHRPDRGDPLTSMNSALIARATEALKQFKFTNTSGSSGGCGYIKFTFKLK
jgi:hypothetical protein